MANRSGAAASRGITFVGVGLAVAGTLVLIAITLLLCLIPKPGNDTFWELRSGTDILRSHAMPHADPYSWENRGTRWDLPEWGACVLFALAYQMARYFGIWLVMFVLALGAALSIWFWLLRRIRVVTAFLLIGLMLLTLADFFQVRPYAFTYLLLAVALMMLTSARLGTGANASGVATGKPLALLWLAPMTAIWTNLHQGVAVLLALLGAYGLGDAVTAGYYFATRTDKRVAAQYLRRSAAMFGLMTACCLASMVSPYGWRMFLNVIYVSVDTAHIRSLMTNISEWEPITTVPLAQIWPFILLASMTLVGAVAGRSRDLGAIIGMAGLFVQALLHARNISLFAIGSVVMASTSVDSVVDMAVGRLPRSMRTRRWSGGVMALSACLFVAVAVQAVTSTLPAAIGPRGYSPEGIGEAAIEEPSYPDAACAFIEAEGFPPNLRMFNNFDIGGYLDWRLPSEPVFIDGRSDVYIGRTLDDFMTLLGHRGSPQWWDVVRRYDFDCVITTAGKEAKTFALAPGWQLVYAEPKIPGRQRCWIILRRRPEFQALIARCLRDCPAFHPAE